jgi:hypothetical protein
MKKIHSSYFEPYGDNKQHHQKKNNNNQEIEVYHDSPKPDKYYFTALYTRKEGKWDNQRYFTTNKPIYAGKHIRGMREGWGDGACVYELFDQDENIVRVNYTYEGTTCFVEVSQEEKIYGSYELIDNIRSYHTKTGGIPKIITEELIKEVYSPRRIQYILDNYCENIEQCFVDV